MLPDGWTGLSPLVDAVLDVPSADREARIIELTAGDAARAAALRALVADCEREMPQLDVPAPAQFAQLIATDPEQPLPDLLGDRYRIERELGRGGMARVFLALDTKHNRHVAVKVIRPELAASLGRERFLREIAIAARLRHPNIVPLYDSGDADGVLYFVMPYEDGKSLRQRIDEHTPVAASEYVSVLRDVARALAYAHEQGVVHRDVKPDNVMLSRAAAVVTDFGIAKAVSVAQGGTGSTSTLTQTGSGIGTPTYMAPEQAVGDPDTDHRADIYAFGCLAYELISGEPPFHDLPIHQLIAAHVATTPVDIAARRADVPDAVSRIVMQCLEKEPAARPQSADALLSALDEALRGAPRMQALTPVPDGRSRERGLLFGVAILTLIGMLYFFTRASTAPLSRELTVAVLPMQSIGGDSTQVDLAKGLSGEIAFELFRVPGVRVMSQRTLADYRGSRDVETAALGRKLGARFLVMGTYREEAAQLQIRAKLIDAPSGAILWIQEFQRDVRDLSVVRSAIARAVADTLRSQLEPAIASRPLTGPAPRDVDPEAYRFYVLGTRALAQRSVSFQASIDNFLLATDIDSTYAAAWAGLSLAHALSPYFKLTNALTEDSIVRSTATRALRLDSTLSAAHVALGLQHQHEYQWDSAGAEFSTAVRLRSPGDVEPLIQYGRHLLLQGRPQEAMRLLRMARQTEPASALVSTWIAYAYYLDGRPDSALAEGRRAYQSDTTNLATLSLVGLMRQTLGLSADARRLADKLPPMNFTHVFVLAAQGDSTRALAAIRKGESRLPRPGLIATARAFAMLGALDTAAAIRSFEQATDAHEIWPSLQSTIDPVFAPLWPSPRFRALLKRVGLGEMELPRAPKR